VYAKGPGDIARGKIHGSVDIGLSVLSTKVKRKRIDIDAEEFIYHLKVSVHLLFGIVLLIVSLGYGCIIQPNYGAVENLHLFENCISWDAAACIR